MAEIKKDVKPITNEVGEIIESPTKAKPFYYRIQEVRTKINNDKNLKKTGHNKYSNFYYFELGDFTPTADKLFLENGIFPWFEFVVKQETKSRTELPATDENLFKYDYENVEYAVLTLHDIASEKFIKTECKTVECEQKGVASIQAAGAKHTYYRRYLYIDALNLAESDGVDASDNNGKDSVVKKIEEKPVKKPKKEETVEIKSDELMTQETRSEIQQYIKSKNGEKSTLDVINQVAESMKIDKIWFKETDKEEIFEIIDALDSIGDL